MSDAKENDHKLLTLTEASEFLGYKSNAPIKKLIAADILKTYSVPQSKRGKVKLSDLLKIIQPTSPEEENETPS